MAKIKGPSGVVVEAADAVASGLVNAGYAEYVKDAPKDEPKDKPAEGKSKKKK